jgi:two-component system response regulator HydG
VLITGETGVGKELIAKALHSSSSRCDHPFVKVNCAAIPDTLAESELFGYERGAFTGAAVSKPGRFELAQRGTIFLDEVGDMALAMQSRFLGVLQDRAFTRIGGVKTIQVDLRVIAATNRDLDADVTAGRFRADLLYRLKVVPIHVPALRERREDIPRLVGHFLKKCTARHRKALPLVQPEVLAVLTGYDWPGNIRELENVVERMVLLAETDAIGLDQLPAEIRGLAPSGAAGSFREKLDDVSRAAEKQLLLDAMGKTSGNRTKAAQLLGISRRTIQNKIKEYGL